ncbi:hypothetical protein EVA_16692 [gut metagenome]|uniref:Uncharacterized protein n=1 Tax=gut metagenome TaxID=749906 RepID=J9FJX0_9ZZZZ
MKASREILFSLTAQITSLICFRKFMRRKRIFPQKPPL